MSFWFFLVSSFVIEFLAASECSLYAHTQCWHVPGSLYMYLGYRSTHQHALEVSLLWGLNRPGSILVHDAGGWGLPGLWSRGTHRIFLSWFSRCRTRNFELSYDGCYCLSLLAGMGLRGEFLLPAAPVVSMGIEHGSMESKQQDTFLTWTSLSSCGQQVLGTSFLIWSADTETRMTVTENSACWKTNFHLENPFHLQNHPFC